MDVTDSVRTLIGDASEDASIDAPVDAGLPPCPSGLARCGDACVDTSLSPQHCGMCGFACPARSNAAPACAAGACHGVCNTGFADCDGDASNGCETRLDDALACGACGTRCADPTPLCQDDGGRYACVSGCGGAASARCGGSCVDARTDAQHCGGCNRACPAPTNGRATCVAGTCGTACDAGYHACGTACADDTAVATCGTLCSPCPARANATATCTAGACGFTCDAGFADCDGDASNGCESDTRADTSNCGACGTACTGGRSCVSGTCACPPGQSFCGGACASTGESCTVGVGGCARWGVTVCAGTGTGTRCSVTPGAEAAETCDNIDNDCDGAVDEELTRACYRGPAGTSGVGPCRAGVQTCTAGAWSATCAGEVLPRAETCNGVDDDCSGMVDEPPAASQCPSAPNASQRCAAGVCGLLCNAGFGDCDRMAATGCEADLANDTANCGGCGVVCAGDQVCVSGACSRCGIPGTVLDAIVTSPDGLTSTVGPDVELHRTVYLRGYGGAFERGGRIWFAEGTTSCGGWRTRVTSFAPESNGTPGGVVDRCETVNGPSVGVSMASGGALGLCYQTHAPEYAVRCGRLGSSPGTYADVAMLGTNAGIVLAAGPGGFAGGLQNSVTGNSTLSLQTFDLNMNPLRRTPLVSGEDPMAVARVGSQWWLARRSARAPVAVSIDRVADDGALAGTIRLPPIGAASASATPSLTAVPSPEGLNFALSIGNELYLGMARADGIVGARRFFQDTAPVQGLLVGYGTGWVVVARRSAGGAEGVWVLRLDCRGAVVEAPRRVAAGAEFAPWGATIDATGRGLWVVLARNLGAEDFALSTRRVMLP